MAPFASLPSSCNAHKLDLSQQQHRPKERGGGCGHGRWRRTYHSSATLSVCNNPVLPNNNESAVKVVCAKLERFEMLLENNVNVIKHAMQICWEQANDDDGTTESSSATRRPRPAPLDPALLLVLGTVTLVLSSFRGRWRQLLSFRFCKGIVGVYRHFFN